jgi:hypothetical protein
MLNLSQKDHPRPIKYGEPGAGACHGSRNSWVERNYDQGTRGSAIVKSHWDNPIKSLEFSTATVDTGATAAAARGKSAIIRPLEDYRQALQYPEIIRIFPGVYPRLEFC